MCDWVAEEIAMSVEVVNRWCGTCDGEDFVHVVEVVCGRNDRSIGKRMEVLLNGTAGNGREGEVGIK